MENTILFISMGIIGALLRILITTTRTIKTPKEITNSGFILYTIATITLGAFSGLTLGFTIPTALLGGYAGIDLADKYYTTMKKVKVKM